MIDLWNYSSFNIELQSLLSSRRSVIDGYLDEEKRRDDTYEHIKTPAQFQKNPFQKNPFSDSYLSLRDEELPRLLKGRRARCWHYTRLCDFEVVELKAVIMPTSPDFLDRRLENLIDRSLITRDEAEIISGQSALLSQGKHRNGQFCCLTHPLPASNQGVELLLQYWGGESAYFHLQNCALLNKLETIGHPCIVEISLPMTDDLAFLASRVVIATDREHRRLFVERTMRDFLVRDGFESLTVENVWISGCKNFDRVGVMYPDGVKDVYGWPPP
jgi:hypothetical protein